MRLLAPEAFAHIFQPLQGKRIGFVRPIGNVGDALIEWGTRQLFEHYSINWQLFDPDKPSGEVDELVWGGGGNMGTLWQNNWLLRSRCLELGLPMTILPQSFTSREDRRFHRVFVRERASMALATNGILGPDLALGLDYTSNTRPSHALGIFLRKDVEGIVPRRWFSRDPVRLCRTGRQYIELAARYEHVVTDRLHFAISSLIVGRRTTLLPNVYHKNLGMYNTWLKDLGCQFAASLHEVRRRLAAETSSMSILGQSL
ncbi:MAG: polysaccharide pyruvyl transferase family protein [Pirellulales bacterium]|nr:polysaccharide pyruvyl transferase family protein [Pirellulales bacterium]